MPASSLKQRAKTVANRTDSSSAWVKENPGWRKIGVMCLEYWQWADQYHFVWDYVKLIGGLRKHLFHWEQMAASFITVLTKSLQISHPNCDPGRSHQRGAMETFPMLRVKVLHFNDVKYLQTPRCCSLMTNLWFTSPESIFPEGWCFLVRVMHLPALPW